MTIMQERKKVNILIFDNCGFGCINNLEMNNGIGSLATEFRYTDGRKPTGDLIYVDYAKIGEGYGLSLIHIFKRRGTNSSLKDV